MDQKNAVKLLDNTFNQDFDLERFSLFIKELFNHFNLRINENIPLRKEYYDYINQMDSLGVYRDNNGDSIEVFAVQLKKTSSRDRARTMQRNLIAKYLKNSGSNAALVAFYGDDPQDWRFSFVKIEYDLIKDEKGNLKVKEDITPARRFSFLVGKNEPNHTCRRQFLDLIEEESEDPLLKEIEQAFGIENVTLEFFEKYKNLFLKLQKSLEEVIKTDEIVKNEFNKRNIPTADFAKKLMGQIVFIYFLQKKGWLGVDKGEKWGKGPRNFLRKLFNKGMVDYKNFFNDILEPLFYEALATPRDDDYYRHFDCKIPFLNGGLFEPINDYDWVKTEITLKNNIFKEILDVFDLYNFTIKEDEPLEKEVAVDPEMLGKVFENLLDVDARKSQGAFYTPREIVHYMCQKSIINYIDTNSDLPLNDIENFIHLGDFALDLLIREIIEYGKLREDREYGLPTSIKENHRELNTLLQKIKVVDPAVGSGAFPVGMMNEIVKARSILSFLSGEEKTYYELKMEIIRDCLYGVDIDSSAVDIAKLRFWLSLIVDEEDIGKIEPLPNLDHKIMCGNSLLEEFNGKKLFDDELLSRIGFDNSEELNTIKKRLDELYIQLGMIQTGKISKNVQKNEIEKEIKKLDNQKRKLESYVQDNDQQFTLDDDYETRKIKESQRKLKQLDRLHKKFFSEQNSKKKKRYREEFERIEWDFIEEKLQEDGNENSIQKIESYKKNKSKPFFLWKLYFNDVFKRPNPGFDVVIANPPYGIVYDEEYKALYEEKFPSFKRNNDIYIAFYENSLLLARDNGTTTFITPNTFLNGDYYKKWRKTLTTNAVISEIRDFKNIQIFEDPTVFVAVLNYIKRKKIDYPYSFRMKISKESIEDFNIDIVDVEKGSEKTIKATNPLFKKILNQKNVDIIDNILFVKDVGFNYWTKGRGKKRGGDSIGKRVLYRGIKSDPKDIPFLKGRDINKYHIKTPENYLKHNYKDYLDDEIDTFRFSENFLLKNPKVIYRQTSNKIVAAIDFNSYYLDKTVHLIVHKDGTEIYDLKYILSLLNSKLFNYLYEFISQEMAGRTFAQVKTTYIKQLPLKKISEEDQEPFIQLIDKILGYTKDDDYLDNKNKQGLVKDLEKEIDKLVYNTYNLTDKEIIEVEQFNMEREGI